MRDLVDKIGISRMVCCSIGRTLLRFFGRFETVRFNVGNGPGRIAGFSRSVDLKICLTNFSSEISSKVDSTREQFRDSVKFILTIMFDDIVEIAEVNKKGFLFIGVG